jgi:hypothetical protein
LQRTLETKTPLQIDEIELRIPAKKQWVSDNELTIGTHENPELDSISGHHPATVRNDFRTYGTGSR